MSFLTKIGQDAEKDQKLVMLRRKYFRNILEFNQVWQHEKRQTEVKAREQSNNQFSKIVKRELEALETEKERLWKIKINNQDVLKEDYQKQMHEKVEKFREEKVKDKEYIKMQAIENDKISQRRLLDLMKIYDRKAVRNTLHRRTKTEANETTENPQIKIIDSLESKPTIGQVQLQKKTSDRQKKQLILRDHFQHKPKQAEEKIETALQSINDSQQKVKNNLQELKKELTFKISKEMHLPPISSPKARNSQFPPARLDARKNMSRSWKYLPSGQIL